MEKDMEKKVMVIDGVEYELIPTKKKDLLAIDTDVIYTPTGLLSKEEHFTAFNFYLDANTAYTNKKACDTAFELQRSLLGKINNYLINKNAEEEINASEDSYKHYVCYYDKEWYISSDLKNCYRPGIVYSNKEIIIELKDYLNENKIFPEVR